MLHVLPKSTGDVLLNGTPEVSYGLSRLGGWGVERLDCTGFVALQKLELHRSLDRTAVLDSSAFVFSVVPFEPRQDGVPTGSTDETSASFGGAAFQIFTTHYSLL
jgi:hypothetical protein